MFLNLDLLSVERGDEGRSGCWRRSWTRGDGPGVMRTFLLKALVRRYGCIEPLSVFPEGAGDWGGERGGDGRKAALCERVVGGEEGSEFCGD